VVATYDLFRGEHMREAAVSVRHAMDGGLVTLAGATEAWFSGSFVLSTTQLEDVMPFLDKTVAEAQRGGSTLALALGYGARGVAHYWRGELDEALHDLASAIPPAEALGPGVVGPTQVFSAYVLIEKGQLDEAERVLGSVWTDDEVPPVGVWWWFLYGRGRLLLELGRWEAAVDALQACGRRYAAHGWTNPAVIPWRSYTAIGLHQLGRSEQASELVAQDLEIARRWGDARTIGQTLRIAAQVNPSERRELLEEALGVLEGSAARLEHARSHAAMGSQLASQDDRTGAHRHLAQALDLATRCNADGLASDVLASMRALGFRPRRQKLHGPESLTPSERQIARLASQGITNRQIAQDLFVSIKTVETHLAAAFKKLSVSGRDQLADALAAEPPTPRRS
jgi:DNA-binding CsgD family transcriptional regulator